MNYTFNYSALSQEQKSNLDYRKKHLKLYNLTDRQNELNRLFDFWVNKKGVNLFNETEWNFILNYFGYIGFTYSEILSTFMEKYN